MCTDSLSLCMSGYHVPAWCPQSPEEGVGPSGTGVTDGCGCWNLNLSPLEEQPVLVVTDHLSRTNLDS